MKKFLFTLAALLMAGSMYADNYLYIDGFEVAEAQLGTEIEVPVKAHFDNRVSAFELWVNLPAGMEVVEFDAGADMTGMKYYTQTGREKSLDASITTLDNTHFVAITSATTVGYYQDETGAWVPYLAIKWEPGDYEEMIILYVAVAEDFAGGDVSVRTMPASGEDPRGNTCPKGEDWTIVNNIHVEGAVPPQPEVTEKPVITYEEVEGGVNVTDTGAGHICLYVEDMLVAEGEGVAEYFIASTELEEEYGVSATAQEEGKEVSEYALATIYVPALPVVPEVTEKPVITYVDDPEAQTVTVTATGAGHICLYWDDMLQAEGEGTAEWVIPYGDDPEGEEYGISATAQEEGKEISEYALATIFVPGKEVTPPEPQELTGDIVVSEPDANGIVTVTYTGDEDVTVTVTVNGVPVEGDIQLEEGENVIVVNVTAPGYEPMEETFVVEYTPGPQVNTYVLVVVDADGVEHFFDLNEGSDGNYTTTLTLDYNPYFPFEWDPNLSDAENKEAHPVSFYFLVNGQRYGAEGNVATVMGYALENLLDPEADGFYTVPVGYAYTLGLAIYGEEYYVYAAVANPTSVDELANGKTVAGVRYFNMAGQEMQEANGMTIVVTTYTDGTTNAVKVIK